MKSLSFLFYVFFGFVGVCYSAGALVVESPVSNYGTPVTLSISSTTLTMLPSSQTSGRVGVFLSLPQGNTGMVGFLGNCTSTSLASTIRPIEISTATGMNAFKYISMREDVCLWLLSLNTNVSAQNINYQEVKQ